MHGSPMILPYPMGDVRAVPDTAPPPEVEPTCPVGDIAAFRPGEQNGEPYTVQDLFDLARNFALLGASNLASLNRSMVKRHTR